MTDNHQIPKHELPWCFVIVVVFLHIKATIFLRLDFRLAQRWSVQKLCNCGQSVLPTVGSPSDTRMIMEMERGSMSP